MQLPIEQVPDTNPPVFRWKYVANTPNGKVVVDQEGTLSPSIEVAMQRMISIAKQLLMENASLHGQVKSLTEKVADYDRLYPTGTPNCRQSATVEPPVTPQPASLIQPTTHPVHSKKGGK